jgi:hypothetical protein
MGLLSDLQVKAAQPREKEYLLSDGGACTSVFARQARCGFTGIKWAKPPQR